MREYPKEIEECSMLLFDNQKSIEDYHFESGLISDAITAQVSSDKAYTNDLQRRAEIKLRLANAEGYQPINTRVRLLMRETARLTAQLERLRREHDDQKLTRQESTIGGLNAILAVVK